MGFLDSLFGSEFPVEPVTDDLHHRVATASTEITPTSTAADLAGDERALMHIRPFHESDGFDAATTFTRDLYRPESVDQTGKHTVETMELWFSDGQIQQRYCTRSPQRVDQVVSSRYEHSTIHTPDRAFLELRPDEYVASAQLHLQQDCAFPIRHPESTLDSMDSDPYTALASALAGPDETRALVQIAFTPVGNSWSNRGVVGSLREGTVEDIAERRKEGTVKGEVNPRIVEGVRSDRLTAMDMQSQQGKPAFQTAVRLVTTAPTEHAVRERMGDLVGAFEAFTYPATEQRFVPTHWSGDMLTASLEQAASRTLVPRGWLKRTLFGRQSVLTFEELAGLMHLSNKEINAPLFDWERMESGAGAPGTSERFTSPTASTDRAVQGRNQALPETAEEGNNE